MSRELAVPMSNSMILLCDNKAAIDIAKNSVHHDRTKHVEIDRHLVKEKVEEGIIQLTYIPTGYQTADILTKALPRSRFNTLKSKLHMIDINDPQLEGECRITWRLSSRYFWGYPRFPYFVFSIFEENISPLSWLIVSILWRLS